MARVFVAGFESHGTEVFNTVSGATRNSTSYLDMDGNYCLECAANTDYAIKTLTTSYDALYFAFRYRLNSNADGYYSNLITFYDSAGTAIGGIRKNISSNLPEFYSESALATGITPVNISKTYLIEIYYYPKNSGGSCILKIDGVQQFSYSGDTTAGLENIQTFRLGYDAVSSRSGYSYYDDIIIDDAHWIGKTYIQGLTITGAGTTTQWDPSTGSNYACVDEVPYSDTDYISTNTTDEIDTYALSNLSGTIDSIKAVALTARAAYDGSPTPTHIQLGVRSGGADYFATDFSPPSSFGFLGQRILEVDPATSAAWTESNVNALEAGMKATT